MDELILDDKKYLSSKRAAKMTGYAKDYIGQLCREGRVNARLVGRSWYVLESALHDHRFGEKEADKKASPSTAVFSATWGEPKYEPDQVEESIPETKHAADEGEEPEVTADKLQESWQAWFNRVGTPGEPEEVGTQNAEAQTAEQVSEAVSIPIRAIRDENYQPLPHEIMAKQENSASRDENGPVADVIITPKHKKNGGVRTLQVAGVLLAIVMCAFAVAGSGYMDSYLLKSGALGAVAGVNIYDR
ncbi:MAG TPA: helix-turn-helix domain-containing protein [Candidatus Paceibacterota bacterium]|nr:helix-turn-helix domain-containing protein [Candidatus Paceibacterota bacterium]